MWRLLFSKPGRKKSKYLTPYPKYFKAFVFFSKVPFHEEWWIYNYLWMVKWCRLLKDVPALNLISNQILIAYFLWHWEGKWRIHTFCTICPGIIASHTTDFPLPSIQLIAVAFLSVQTFPLKLNTSRVGKCRCKQERAFSVPYHNKMIKKLTKH